MWVGSQSTQDARCFRVLEWSRDGDRHGCLWEAVGPGWLLPLSLQLQLLMAVLGSLWFCRADSYEGEPDTGH